MIQGSYRGLRFYTLSTSVTPGHRRAIYEIPFDDRGAASVDLGRRPRRYALNICLISAAQQSPAGAENLENQIKAFIDALDQPGPGLLVHPYLGRVMVLPDDNVSINTSTDRQGFAEISFTCVESRAVVRGDAGPEQQTETRAALPKATAALREANEQAFESTWLVEGAADFVRTAHLATLDTALANLRAINSVISAALAVPGELASTIQAIALQLTDLVDVPDRLYSSLAGVIESVYTTLRLVRGRLGGDVPPDGDTARPDAISVSISSLKQAIASVELTSGSPAPSQRDTPDREQERINRAALDHALHAAALAAICDAANELELPAKSDNETVRDLLLASVDALFAQEVASAVADALHDLRAAVWSRYTGRGTTVTELVLQDSMPADVLAYQLYGDAERMQEIVDRNGVADPGAVPAMVALEVLSS